jgi:RNA recognition motif-containing protein
MANRLYVGGLSADTTDEELKAFFQQAGTVESATVVTDRATGRSKGFAFVEMSSPAEAKQAVTDLHDKMLGKKAIKVEEARPARVGPEAQQPAAAAAVGDRQDS